MDTVDDVLLADITEHPDDDLPRLVYADRLQERDDPRDRDRGEFIELQCGRREMTFEEWEASRCREDALFQLHEEHWVPKNCREMQPVFQRGFLEQITIGTHATACALSRILRGVPTIRTLVLAGSLGDDEFLSTAARGFPALRSARIGQIQELHLTGMILDGQVMRHLINTRMEAVKMLTFSEVHLDSGSLRTLLTGHSSFPALETLAMDTEMPIPFRYRPLAMRELRAFAREPLTTLPSLTSLHLKGSMQGVGRDTLRLLQQVMEKRSGKLIAKKPRRKRRRQRILFDPSYRE